MNRTALVTGGTGYIGSRLVHRLMSSGYAVHVIARLSSETSALPQAVPVHRYSGAFECLSRILTTVSPSVVFHLASKYIADHKPDQIQELIESNVHFPVQIAEAMAAAGTKLLINTGTLSQHYHSHDYNPASLYAATKQACTDILRYYHEARGLSVLTLKLSDTYGPADTRRKLVQLLVDAAVSGERLQMSPGEQILDLTHVDDVVTAFAAAAELLQSSASAVNEEYVVTGERLSVRQLVTLVEQKLDRSIDVHFGARPYRPREIMVPLSPSPEQRLPGWEAQYRLLDTLETLVRPESRAQ